MTTEAEKLQTHVSSDISRDALDEAIPGRRARHHEQYTVEYGIRRDDGALMFHFYPPNTDWSEYPPPREKLGTWSKSFGMHNRLEAAILKCFSRDDVKGSYSEDLRSFCIIVAGAGRSLDPWYLADRFFREIDQPTA